MAKLVRVGAWALAAILFAAYAIAWFFLSPEWNVPVTTPVKRMFVSLFTFMSMTFLPVIILTLLVALIPWPRISYLLRLTRWFPWFLSAWIGFSLFSYSLDRIRMWEEEHYFSLVTVRMENVAEPEDLPCTNLKEGRFHAGDHMISRTIHEQVEISPTGERTIYKIAWRAPCTYELVKQGSEPGGGMVRIIDVQKGWYDCVVGDNEHCALMRVFIDP